MVAKSRFVYFHRELRQSGIHQHGRCDSSIRAHGCVVTVQRRREAVWTKLVQGKGRSRGTQAVEASTAAATLEVLEPGRETALSRESRDPTSRAR